MTTGGCSGNSSLLRHTRAALVRTVSVTGIVQTDTPEISDGRCNFSLKIKLHEGEEWLVA